MATIKERIAALETKVKILLFLASLQLGVEIIPTVSAILW